MEKEKNKKQEEEEIQRNADEALENKENDDTLREMSKKSRKQVEEFFEKRTKLKTSSA